MSNPRLVAISGLLKGTVWAATDGPLFLGRDASNQVQATDAAVSRKHCSVREVSSGEFEIEDLNSHNGTFVNGTKVSRKAIQHGDRIRIGSSEYVFLTGPDDDDALGSSPFGGQATSTELKIMPLGRSGAIKVIKAHWPTVIGRAN